MKESNLPNYIISAFNMESIDTEKFVFTINTDMTLDGDYSEVYSAVDNEFLYILYGEQQIIKTDGNRRIESVFLQKGIEKYKISEIGELKSEIMLSTGRLYSENDDKSEMTIILVFSIGHLSEVQKLIKVVQNIRSGEDALKDVKVDNNLLCPKCKTRYPKPDRKHCPKCVDKYSLTRRLLSFFKFYKNKVAIIFLAMILGALFSIFSPLIGSKFLFDDVFNSDGRFYGAIAFAVLLIFIVRLINVLLNVFYTFVLAKTVPFIVYDLKLKIFKSMQGLSVSFFTSKQTGHLMNRINRDANNIYWFFVDGLPYIIINLLTFLGVFTLMCFLSFKLAIICISVIPIVFICFKFLHKFFRRNHHRNWIYHSKLNSMVSDSVNGQRVIKANAREVDECNRFSEISIKQTKSNISIANLSNTAFPLIFLFMFLGEVIVIAIGGTMVLNGEISLGVLVTFIAYLSMLYGPLQFMSWVSNWWARCIDSAQRVFEIIDAKSDIEDVENPVNIQDIKGNIEIKNVKFEYEPAQPVLKDINLTVEAGTMLGLVGKTGAGKSTLANLIARLYDVTQGEILIDGINVKQLPLELLRKNIGIVSQDIYLFMGSIADNIRYSTPDASIEDVIICAKAAAAHDFIMALPDGYETRIGAGGQDLSGGEKQRLSIARTILQNPKILILDEATAAMDTETESNIQNALTKLQVGRTTISIAHRLSTLRDADTLAVISGGTVVENGTHQELIEKKGEYFNLYSIQLEGLKIINMDA